MINTAYMRVFMLFHFPPHHPSALLQLCQEIYGGNIVYRHNYVGNIVYRHNIYGRNIVHRLKYITGINLNAFKLLSI